MFKKRAKNGKYDGFMKRTEKHWKLKKPKNCNWILWNVRGGKETRRQGTGDQKGPWLAEIYAETYVLLNHD